MENPDNPIISVRIDKWLWSVRLTKTRSVATDLCRRQKVSIDGQAVKPSREVRVGQTVTVRKEGIAFQYRVLKCIEKRVGAPLAQACYQDVTPQEEKDKLALVRGGWIPRRDRGEGRPTKKERRALEDLFDF